MQVIDASAALDLILRTERFDTVASLLDRGGLYAPQVIELEVCSALARLERSGTLGGEEVAAMLTEWRAFPYTPLGLPALCAHAWKFRDAFPVADAFYLSAALVLRAPLLTSDARLLRSPARGVAILLAR